MLHQPITAPNSPDKQPAYQGAIDCGDTLESWVTVMQRAEKLRATLTRAIVEAALLEQAARDNSINCEDGMDTSLTCALADLGLDGLIERINDECARFEDR